MQAAVDAVRLVDHHVHGVVGADLDSAALTAGLTESPWPAPAGTTHLDSQLGFAVRRWCAPVLDLPPHADPAAYLGRRAELGATEVARRLLAASGVEWLLVETGYRADELLAPDAMAGLAGARPRAPRRRPERTAASSGSGGSARRGGRGSPAHR